MFFIIVSAMVPVAELASYKNIPVFSWLANDENFDNKDKATTLIRVIHPLSQLGKKRANIVFLNMTN